MKHYAPGSFKIIDHSNKEYLLTVEYDECADDPRDNLNISTMICWHSRYKLGDKHDYSSIDWGGLEEFFSHLCKTICGATDDELKNLAWEDMLKRLSESDLIYIKQLNLYDHGGITISTSSAYPYNDRWDSSPVGFVYITKEKLIECKLCIETTADWKESADAIIEDEVQIYDYYLRGEVYRYTLKEKITVDNKCPHCGEIINSYDDYEEEVDSCCGFYGCCLEENGIIDSIGFNMRVIED